MILIRFNSIYENFILFLKGHYAIRPADYLWCLIFNWLATLVIATFMDVMLLMDPVVLSVIYVWCQLNKETIVQFWFGTKFKGKIYQ